MPQRYKTIGEFAAFAAKQCEAKADRAADLLHEALVRNLSTPGPAPSLPGEPPHAQTRALLKSVRRIKRRENGAIKNGVEVTDPKAPMLEYGTERVAARPFAGPAAQEVGAKLDGILGRS